MAACRAMNALARGSMYPPIPRQPFGEATRSRATSHAIFLQHNLRFVRCLTPETTSSNSSLSSTPSNTTINLLQVFSSADSLPLNELPVVKMCGITRPSDAAIAAKAGASFIGMILWPKSKRSVPLEIAKQIATVAREHGAEPVGVFVDEDATTIETWCNAAGLSFVQLHGDGARAALSSLPSSLKVIYVLHADKHGNLQTDLPTKRECSLLDWILIDGMQGGSGSKFDWSTFKAPLVSSRHGWFLAGGLKPENVAIAIPLLKPNGVDVSSGIAGQDGIIKDQTLVEAFMNAVHLCKNQYL